MIIHGSDGWYWTILAFSRPIGPFKTREEAADDMLQVMGVADGI